MSILSLETLKQVRVDVRGTASILPRKERRRDMAHDINVASNFMLPGSLLRQPRQMLVCRGGGMGWC